MGFSLFKCFLILPISVLSLLFPATIITFLKKLIQPILLIGEFLNSSINLFSEKLRKYEIWGCFRLIFGWNAGILLGLENLFHGQTERQSSHPYILFPHLE